MSPASKATDGRRKSGSKPSLVVTLSISPSHLRELISPEGSVREDSPIKQSKESEEPQDSQDTPQDDKETKDSPATPAALAPPSTIENASDSNAATPAAEGTPGPNAMGPPADGTKKKGVKRSAANANGNNDGIPKPRGKPGPKKKPRL